MDWLKQLFGKMGSDIVTTVVDGVDRFVESDEDKRKMEILKSEITIQLKGFEQEAMLAMLKDRESAREMYQKDSSLQKVFALVFLVGYVAISAAMILLIFGLFGIGKLYGLDAFQASIISMVFTAMSVKVNTITDFLFGGSKSGSDAEEKMAQTFVKQLPPAP